MPNAKLYNVKLTVGRSTLTKYGRTSVTKPELSNLTAPQEPSRRPHRDGALVPTATDSRDCQRPCMHKRNKRVKRGRRTARAAVTYHEVKQDKAKP